MKMLRLLNDEWHINNDTEVVQLLVALNNQIRALHWFTHSHALHEALGDAYTALDALLDQYVEALQGAYGRYEDDFHLHVFGGDRGWEEVDAAKLKLMGYKPTDSALANLLDEVVAELHKLDYLRTLK